MWVGQVWGHTPEQRVAASTLRRYSFGRLTIVHRRQARHVSIIHIGLVTDATANGGISAWFSPSDRDKKESDGRDPPQGVAPHAHRGVVGAADD